MIRHFATATSYPHFLWITLWAGPVLMGERWGVTSIRGNLECLIALTGTPYQPDFKDSILFIEEVRQEPYKIDCMLSHLDLMGILHQVAGVVFCQFEKCLANYFPDRDGTVDDVINEWAKRLTVPVLKNFAYGHGSNHQYVLPIGGNAILDANANSLTIIFK